MRPKSLFILLAIVTACSDAADSSVDGGAGSDLGARADAAIPDLGVDRDAGRSDGGQRSTLLGTTERPTRIIAPPVTSGPAPLIVLLHGYGASGASQDVYLGVSRAAAARGAYVLVPDGTVDSSGKQFWNATPACCDFGATNVDDVGYLRDLVHQAMERFEIDPARVYFMGHSNGGFMSYRIACEMSGEVAAIFVLAGSDYSNASDCVPTAPVSVMHLHGTSDETIGYAGVPGGFPGAEAAVARWAGYASCDPGLVSSGAAIDIVPSVAGAETEVFHFEGCTPGFDVQLNRMNGASHIPIFNSTMMGDVLDWLIAHRR
ncbi:MAG: hypothetical protein IPK60_03595 [Sandaracinaceae bacterium]|nr:hypothetical protein [Sandaracinaceae bacterium]